MPVAGTLVRSTQTGFVLAMRNVKNLIWGKIFQFEIVI